MADAPKVVHGRVAPVDLTELGNYIARAAGVGINLTDPASEEFIRTAVGLPPAQGTPAVPTEAPASSNSGTAGAE